MLRRRVGSCLSLNGLFRRGGCYYLGRIFCHGSLRLGRGGLILHRGIGFDRLHLPRLGELVYLPSIGNTIIIPDPKMQHKGYGTEAIRILLDMAFKEYNMHRVSIGVVGLNTNALEFYKKIGFKQEGILEEAYYYDNEYSDFIMMRILSHEWK